MKAGDLRRRVTIQQPVESEDQFRTPAVSWEPYATVWAAVEPLSGREFIEAQNTKSELSVRIRMRYLAGVTPGMRVLYGARIFDIKVVIDLEERHREMHLMCSEVRS